MQVETPPPADTLGPLTPPVDAVGGRAGAVTFGALSALRRRRIFHPRGALLDATLDVEGTASTGAPLLDGRGRHHALVRLSRGVGLPERLPDILGLALRVVDAHGPGRHQDILLVTSGEAPVRRHALLPTFGFGDLQFSSVTPYRIGGQLRMLGARPSLSPGTASPRALDEVVEALQDGRLRYQLEVAAVRGPWEPIGVLDVGRRHDDREAEAIRFNPFNTGGGIEPAGVLNTLRRRAYAGSQAGRRAVS